MRHLVLHCWLLSLFLAGPALAAAACDDDYSECKDDCLLSYGGSTKLDMKRSYERCLKKCTKTANLCIEHETETRTNHLDEGALEHSPGSDEVDSNNMPVRTSGGEKKKKAARADPLRDPEDDAPAKPKEALGEGEVPKSSRTQLKSEDEQPSKSKGKEKEKASRAPPEPRETKEPSAEKPRRSREDAPPPRAEPKPSRLDEDVRDDGPRAETPKPEPRSEPKEEAPRSRSRAEEREKDKEREKPKPTPKKDDDDDLKNY